MCLSAPHTHIHTHTSQHYLALLGEMVKKLTGKAIGRRKTLELKQDCGIALESSFVFQAKKISVGRIISLRIKEMSKTEKKTVEVREEEEIDWRIDRNKIESQNKEEGDRERRK